MEELSIRIKVGDMEYSMKIKPEEEEGLRRAGRVINDKIKAYRDQFGMIDSNYMLGMIALDAMANKIKAEENTTTVDTNIEADINALYQKLTTK